MHVYADHAATTKIRDAALAALLRGYREAWGNPSSLHAPGRRAKDALETARETFARRLGAEPREILFTSGGTEADNLALRSGAAAGAAAGKRHILSTKFEHHAVLRTLQALEGEGFSVTLLDIPPDGIVTAEQAARALREDTGLVSVMLANNEIGTIQPVAAIGTLCRERGILFHTDAVAAAGALSLREAVGAADYLSLSAHKFGGPRGVGALYVRRGAPVSPVLLGGEQERGNRAGTENLPGILGAAAAFEEACSRMEGDAAYLTPLRDRLMEGLAAIPGAVINGDPVRRLPGNVSVCFGGVEGEALLFLLDQRGVAASSGSACASGSLDPSHVLLALGRSRQLARGGLRLTLGADNTEEEVAYLLRVLPEIVAYLRREAPPPEEEAPAKSGEAGF